MRWNSIRAGFEDSGLVVMRRGACLRPVRCRAVWSLERRPQPLGHSVAGRHRGDQEVLIDSGTYSYMDPEWRGAFRGSSAHNTVRIDGRDQGTPPVHFAGRRSRKCRCLSLPATLQRDRAVAVCRYQGFSHTRTVEFMNGNEFDIVDQIEGPAGEHFIEQFWHFASSPSELAAGTWSIGDLAEFTAEGGELEEGWRSRCFGSKEAAPVIVVRRRTTLPITLHARLRLKL